LDPRIAKLFEGATPEDIVIPPDQHAEWLAEIEDLRKQVIDDFGHYPEAVAAFERFTAAMAEVPVNVKLKDLPVDLALRLCALMDEMKALGEECRRNPRRALILD
jgi:hypothetical protein